MPEVRHSDPAAALADSSTRLNVADRLALAAAERPQQIAVACPHRWSPGYQLVPPPSSNQIPSAPQISSPRDARYAVATFAELDRDATRIALGLASWGVKPGTRLALLVRPGIEFVTLVFALLRTGATMILIDPGLGRRNIIRCLSDAEPEGFVAVPAVHAARLLFARKFPRTRWIITAGRRWFWGGKTLDHLRAMGATGADGVPLPDTLADDPAAIIFTSGSTGPSKGVLYTHRMFDTQVSEIQSMYDIKPGGVDLGCFPLFALFNSAMGVTTVLPEMDFARPASADPRKLIASANDWQVNQAFASPAVWHVVSEYCATTGARIPSLREIFSCGAPVPASVQRATLACAAKGARMHTPYGATECLPVSTIEAQEILGETASKTDQGAGVCVGRPFDSIEWRVIRIIDDPIATIVDTQELPTGEIGELIVRGPQVSPCYATRTQANAIAKIADAGPIHRNSGPDVHPALCWHRTGDVGYIDDDGRFWYCGRKSQRVETAAGPLYTECVESRFNQHRFTERSALVGIGPRGAQTPVVVVEPTQELYDVGDTWWAHPEYVRWIDELRSLAQQHESTRSIQHFLIHICLPVDVRHNAKINREALASWAADELKGRI